MRQCTWRVTRWSERDQTLFWVSAVEGELWRWNLNDSPHKIIPRFGTTLCFVALRKGGGSAARRRGRYSHNERERPRGNCAPLPRPLNSTLAQTTGAWIVRGGERAIERTWKTELAKTTNLIRRMVMGMYNNYHRAGSSAGERLCRSLPLYR